MKGRAVTPAEKLLHDRIAQMGCVACRQEGILNTYVSIHHVNGRTKPGCHMDVLPLCAPHHLPDGTALAVHGNKARWEAKYGKQADLIVAQWLELGVEYVPPAARTRPPRRKAPAAKPAEKAVQRRQPARRKPEPTAGQVKLLEAQKQKAKEFGRQQRQKQSEWNAQRKLEYQEANSERIAEQKAVQKAAQKQFRRDLKQKHKQAANG